MKVSLIVLAQFTLSQLPHIQADSKLARVRACIPNRMLLTKQTDPVFTLKENSGNELRSGHERGAIKLMFCFVFEGYRQSVERIAMSLKVFAVVRLRGTKS